MATKKVIPVKPPSNIYYDFDMSNIRPDAQKELLDWVLYLAQNIDKKIQLTSHTDSRGNNPYNIALSRRRLKEASDFLVARGVSQDKIVIKLWFGEQRLTNNCGDGQPCDEDKHQLNRRTEISIIE